MNATRIGTFAAVLVLAALLVPATAALPAQANQHAVENANGHSDAAPGEAGEDAGQDSGQSGEFHGPPVDTPPQAPDFVTQVHQSIRSFLKWDITVQELVDSIRSATPDNETAAE